MPLPSVLIDRCLSGAEVGLGLVLAVTPVTFWIAWTPSLLLGANLGRQRFRHAMENLRSLSKAAAPRE